jgi:hypothetical protein
VVDSPLNTKVFTVAFGSSKYAKFALGLGRSLRLIGDPTPRVLVTDIRRDDWQPAFDDVIYVSAPENPYHAKFKAFDWFDADAVIFIDADSLAFKRLDRMISEFRGHPLMVQGWRIGPGDEWWGDTSRVLQKTGLRGLTQFNGGLLYYENGPDVRALFQEVEMIRQSYGDTGLSAFRGHVPDEPCLSVAMERTGIGGFVPDSRDYMNTGTGLIKKLELDVRKGHCQFLCRRRELRLVRPAILHAHLYSQFLVYWRQLRHLQRLEDYERVHPFGYMSQGHRFRRSVEKRILKLQGRI